MAQENKPPDGRNSSLTNLVKPSRPLYNLHTLLNSPYLRWRWLPLSDRPRFLVLGDTGPTGADWLQRCGLEGEIVHADSWDAVLEQLRSQHLDALVANPTDPAVPRGLRAMVQAQRILTTLPDGVAVVDTERRVRWANPTFESWCGGRAVGLDFYEAVG